MDILFRFPNLYPGTRTVIVLKQPKTEGSIRTVYIPETVAKEARKAQRDANEAETGAWRRRLYGLWPDYLPSQRPPDYDRASE